NIDFKEIFNLKPVKYTNRALTEKEIKGRIVFGLTTEAFCFAREVHRGLEVNYYPSVNCTYSIGKDFIITDAPTSEKLNLDLQHLVGSGSFSIFENYMEEGVINKNLLNFYSIISQRIGEMERSEERRVGKECRS